MAYREIEDQNGTTWRVWDTDPHQFAGRQVIAQSHAGGWLTFECGDEKRRVAPAPPRWDSMDPADLLRLLRDAEVVGPRAKHLAEAAIAETERGRNAPS